MKSVRQAGREWPDDTSDTHNASGVELREWEKNGWTYHAKGSYRHLSTSSSEPGLKGGAFSVLLFLLLPGIWVRPTPTSTPYMTLFGSTNLNSRSANLDTELSFLLVTSSESLRQRLGEEVEGLRSHSASWRGGHRQVSLGTKALIAIMGGML